MEFSVSDQGLRKMRRRLILAVIFTNFISCVAIVAGAWSVEPNDISYADTWGTIGLFVLLLVSLSVFVLRSTLTTYSTFVLTITAEMISRRQKNGRVKIIPVTDVTEISRLRGGIIIVQGSHDRIVIPADMEQAVILESALNAIMPIREAVTSGKRKLYEWIGSGLFSVAIIYGYFGGDNLLANCCKLTPLAFLIFLAIWVLVSKKASGRNKRIARYFLIILAFAALSQVIMYFAIMR